MKYIAIVALFAAGTTAAAPMAYAHPHDEAQVEKKESKRIWPFFGNKQEEAEKERKTDEFMSAEEFSEKLADKMEGQNEKIEDSVEILKRKMDDGRKKSVKSKDDIVEQARRLEDAIGESDIFSTFAAAMLAMTEDFDVDKDEENLVLRFDGKKLGQITMNRDHEKEESFDIEGFGQSLRLNKESYKKNGKKKTRIVIEIENGDEDIEINLDTDEGEEL